MAQWFIAQTKPPHLSAIAPWNGISDVYRQNLMFGGIPNSGFLAGVFAHLAGPAQIERPDKTAETHPLMDAYWQDKAAKLESITVPAYAVTDVVTDLHRMGTFEGYRRLGSTDKWLRIDNRQEWSDQYDPANEADLLKFFDHFLRGADNGWQQTPKVRMAILDPGGEDRLNVPYTSWPLQQTRHPRPRGKVSRHHRPGRVHLPLFKRDPTDGLFEGPPLGRSEGRGRSRHLRARGEIG
jgi:predicted acyl esterase